MWAHGCPLPDPASSSWSCSTGSRAGSDIRPRRKASSSAADRRPTSPRSGGPREVGPRAAGRAWGGHRHPLAGHAALLCHRERRGRGARRSRAAANARSRRAFRRARRTRLGCGLRLREDGERRRNVPAAPARPPRVRTRRAAQARARAGAPAARDGPRAPGPDVSPVDQPTRSPWLAQLADDGPPQPPEAAASAPHAVVGAGIAGVATAFFVLRRTSHSVLLIERDGVARGATGRNAGQLTTYFERPLCDIAGEF